METGVERGGMSFSCVRLGLLEFLVCASTVRLQGFLDICHPGGEFFLGNRDRLWKELLCRALVWVSYLPQMCVVQSWTSQLC